MALRLRFLLVALDLRSVLTATGIIPSWFSMVIGLDGIKKTKVRLV